MSSLSHATPLDRSDPGSGPRGERQAASVGAPAPTRVGSIGVMGGTFDPIHVGHLAIAEEAREVLGLERVLFVPASVPPHRVPGTFSEARDRAAMVELAIVGNATFALSRVELDRPGPSFTSDTLDELAERERAGGREPDLTFILSAETLRDLPTWHAAGHLVDSCRVAVVPREGYPSPDPAWLRATFPGREDRFDLLEGPRLGLSSTSIRRRVAVGRSIRYLVPPAVAAYITDHHLYRSPS